MKHYLRSRPPLRILSVSVHPSNSKLLSPEFFSLIPIFIVSYSSLILLFPSVLLSVLRSLISYSGSGFFYESQALPLHKMRPFLLSQPLTVPFAPPFEQYSPLNVSWGTRRQKFRGFDGCKAKMYFFHGWLPLPTVFSSHTNSSTCTQFLTLKLYWVQVVLSTSLFGKLKRNALPFLSFSLFYFF